MTTLTGAIGGWARGRMLTWLARSSSPENPSTNLANPAQWLSDFVTGGASAAGVRVTEEKAAGVAVANACVTLISKTKASLPIHIYQETEQGRIQARNHPLSYLLRKKPNDYQTSFQWRQLAMAHVLLWGNHYSQILFDRAGRVKALLPLHPVNVTPRLTQDGSGKEYEVRMQRGQTVVLPDEEMLHIPGLSFDGIVGISPVRKLRNTFGLSLASEEFAGKFFANGAKMGHIIETPGKMKEEAQQRLVHSIIEKFGALAEAFKPLVLEEGVKMHAMQMPLKDAEFLGWGQLSDARIAGAYGVPPHMVGIGDKTSSWGTGIEQMDIGFAKHTIHPWCEAFEQEFDSKLFKGGEEFYARYSLDGLQRGDYKTRMEGYQIGIQNSVMVIDEVRELENLPPLPNGLGKRPIAPANMTTLEKLGETAPEPKPAKEQP